LFLRATFVAAAIAMAAMLTLAGCAVTGGAQAATFEPGLPLSPASQQNAVRAAKQYLEMTAYSHDGLIKQLEYEHYSAEDATYAADNVNATHTPPRPFDGQWLKHEWGRRPEAQ
jgi:hypothetical protein